KKDVGDAAFKNGDVKSALRSYHEAVMYLVGIDRQVIANALNALGMGVPTAPSDGSKDEQKNEVDLMLEKIYANMSACHIKQENWKRAIETADKALAKNPKNSKALFRKAKALGESGYFDKAEATLTEVKKNSFPLTYRTSRSEEAIVDAELTRLRAIDDERQRVADKKMRGNLLLVRDVASLVDYSLQVGCHETRRLRWRSVEPSTHISESLEWQGPVELVDVHVWRVCADRTRISETTVLEFKSNCRRALAP
ncbi:hypothetical protein EDC04DRAFT_2564164, partial [Pisolithus marmoratus]